jgi:hypothetical protein
MSRLTFVTLPGGRSIYTDGPPSVAEFSVLEYSENAAFYQQRIPWLETIGERVTQ